MRRVQELEQLRQEKPRRWERDVCDTPTSLRRDFVGFRIEITALEGQAWVTGSCDLHYEMSPRLQKFALLAHVTFSVGWFGAVVPYLALVIVGLTSRDAESFRATYLSMELIGWYVIVPFSLAALLSGLLQSLGTQWGLLRHWWILAKLALTVFAVAILLQHMRDVSRVARIMQTAGFQQQVPPGAASRGGWFISVACGHDALGI